MSYLTGHWSFDPFLLVVLAIVFAHEVGLARLRRRSSPAHARRRRLYAISFYAGLGVLLLSVESPIDYWASDYFFVHMLEHLLIAFYAPILIVFGAPWIPLLHALPVGARRRAGRSLILGAWSAPLRRVGRFVANPWFALISFNVVMVGWHLPALFDLSENNQAIHIWLMHGSFLVTGVLFWLQIIPSRPFRPRMSPMWQAGTIISTNIVMFMLAMALSIFSSTSWYAGYAHVARGHPGALRRPADRRRHPLGLWRLLGRARPHHRGQAGHRTGRVDSQRARAPVAPNGGTHHSERFLDPIRGWRPTKGDAAPAGPKWDVPPPNRYVTSR